ncbi:MAG: TatD family hydrolase [Calditrichaceae bacterium]|nr:TatD family hydrolase [Calditrichia bacterium]NUQ39928.1 TatD family hydrolase [Calditrichaceae bacterium]
MTYIDTHTHLHFEEFDGDREAVITRAREAGVAQIITLGTGLTSSTQTLEIARRRPHVFAAAGIHPSEAHLAAPGDVDAIRDLAKQEAKIVAIGEIGLDFYWDKTYHREQYQMFRAMLRIARELAMPVAIHNRSAQREMQWFFQEEKITTLDGVMHCFAGEVIDARFYLEMGLHISFTADITFPNFSRGEVLKFVPLDRLLLETDSPFIPPSPLRKQRNEPANVVYVAEKLAEIHRKPREEIARITTGNARRLFRLPQE